jgi:hypothetical protein
MHGPQHLRAPRALAAFAIVIGVLAGGCSAGTTVTPDAGVTCFLGDTMPLIEQKLFKGPKCLICHTRLTLFPTGFDLQSDNLASRVVDKMAAEMNPAKGKCAGHVLLPHDDPLGSLFVAKVSQTMPPCGDQMPQSMTPLSEDEITCVKAWATMAVQAVH